MNNNSPAFNDTDRDILALLQADASITNAELAKRVGLSPSACLGRVKRLRESGVIKQMTAIVDEKKIGLEVAAFVFISLRPHDRRTTERFLGRIHEIPQVMECHNISGAYDYLLKVVAPSIAGYRNFVIDTLIEVPGVDKVETSVILSTEKCSHSLPLAQARPW